MSKVATICLRDLKREYDENTDNLLRNSAAQLRLSEIDIDMIVDNMARLGGSKRKILLDVKF